MTQLGLITYEVDGPYIRAWVKSPVPPYNTYHVHAEGTHYMDREEVLYYLKSKLEQKIAFDIKEAEKLAEASVVVEKYAMSYLNQVYEKYPDRTISPRDIGNMLPGEYAEFRTKLDSIRTGHTVVLPAPIQPAKPRPPLKPEPVTKPVTGTYETHYWSFVNAKTQEKADEALTAMVNKVTMELEPRPDGKSWVEEPAVLKTPAHGRDNIAAIFYRIGILCILAGILQLILPLFS